jgi:hypothetical protein
MADAWVAMVMGLLIFLAALISVSTLTAGGLG